MNSSFLRKADKNYHSAYHEANTLTSAITSKHLNGDFPSHILSYPVGKVLNHLRAGVLIVDDNDMIAGANDIFIEASKRIISFEKIDGKNYHQALRQIEHWIVNAKVFFQEIAGASEQCEATTIEMRLVNGKIFSVDYIPLIENDKPTGAIFGFVDISRKGGVTAAAGEEEKLNTIFDNLHLGFCEIDLEGKITKVYGGFCKLTGYSRKELTGRSITDVFIPRERREEALQLRNERIRQGANPILFEMEIIARDGSHKWVLTSSANLFDSQGNISGGIDIHMDITQQKEQYLELEKSKRTAEESQVALQQFLASMSHEIRTPLNAIIGMSHLLSDTRLTREQKEYVQILKSSSNILFDLISDILDFSKIESGNIELQHREFDLVELVKTLTNTFQFKLKRKPVTVSFIPDEQIKNYLIGDDILLNQVLLNLLGNAEKFTEDGSIEVSAHLLKVEDDKTWIKFKVKDTGIGIEKDKLQLIFQDFKQASKEIGAAFGGTGLGLSISKKLIELHGGNILVESKPGEGSCFSFTLPFRDTGRVIERIATPVVANPIQQFENAYVLIVEDNMMNLKYLSSLLGKYNIQFEMATNGIDALELMKHQQYSLILMDIKIPGIEGVEVSRLARNDEENPNAATPIVLITAAALQSTVNIARENGINDLLTKPYTPDQLLQVLRKYLNDDETENISLSGETMLGAYEFSPRLDVNYLNTLYEQNVEYALGLFSIFIESAQADWAEVCKAAADGDLVVLRQLVHKIKPNFSMVGLTWITHEMELLEQNIKESGDPAQIPELIKKSGDELEMYFPAVVSEFKNMEAHLAGITV